MDNILENIAIIINSNSKRYEARIPKNLREYCEIINGRIIKVSNRVLRIECIFEKRKNKVWYIFERDIEKVICKIARRDKGFSKRVEEGSLSVYDVECIIRRCTFEDDLFRLSTDFMNLILLILLILLRIRKACALKFFIPSFNIVLLVWEKSILHRMVQLLSSLLVDVKSLLWVIFRPVSRLYVTCIYS